MKNEAQLLVKYLREQGLNLAFAESVTGGLAAYRLSCCIGASEVLRGSVVCYTPGVKTGLMGVSKKMIDTYTCESAQVTAALAKKLPAIIKADIYGAITGLASAGGSETKDKPVGTLFFSILYKKKIYNYRHVFRGSPQEIKKKGCAMLYKLILSKTRA